MQGNDEHVNIVRQWVEKAEEDLKNAEYTLTMKEGCPFGTVCFHAQQCVEKYMKAVLIFHGLSTPKTHDIEGLTLLLPVGPELNLSLEDQRRLTSYAIITRYPGDWEPVTRKEAKRAVSLARRVRKILKPLLPVETRK